VAVVQATDAGSDRLSWVLAPTRPIVRPPVPLDRDLRRQLGLARAFEIVAGSGAAWGVGMGAVNVAMGSYSPILGTGVTAGPSLPMEATLIGTDLALHRVHARLEELGRRVPKHRLVAAEVLQYLGLGVQVAASLAVIGRDPDHADVPYAASSVPQLVGSALQLGAVVAYEADRQHLQRLAATIAPAPGVGATMGVQGTF
jgi:hypothetical protein